MWLRSRRWRLSAAAPTFITTNVTVQQGESSRLDERRIGRNGAAWESNPPSAGLRRLTGFEDRWISSPGVPPCPRSPSRTGSRVRGVRLRPLSTPASGLSW
jgi:hypothetical protein